MPTAAEKILSRACGRAVAAGEIVHPVPDLVTLHDWYVTHAAAALDRFGVAAVQRPERVLVSTDHEPVATSPAAVLRQAEARRAAARFGFGLFHDVGREGLGHVFPVERGIVRPGMLVMGYDPHLTNFGAVGALGLAVLNEVTELLACGTVWTEVPETVRVTVEGRLAPGVTLRDAAQLFIATTDPAVLDNAVVEFVGPGMAAIDVDGRMTLMNTPVELGARSALAEPDAVTEAYCRERGGAAEALRSDPDARFRARLVLDLAAAEPLVAVPPRPECAVPVGAVAGRRIDHAYIGSCASGFIADLRLAAGVLRGRRVAPHVRLFITPVTQAVQAAAAREGLLEVFAEAGAVVTAPGCGVCAGGRIGGVGRGEVSIGTGTRNDPGRLGDPDAALYLAGPLTVAASAVAGVIRDPRLAMAAPA
jgi:3-isopropylmalate/(R)-2-methylmalate dehydratase large subunit